MDPVADLAQTLRDAIPSGLRVLGGRVVAVVDGTHVQVDIGGRVVTAYAASPAAVGADVRLLVGSGSCEVLSSAGVSTSWTAPTLTNSWADYAAGVVATGYRRVGDVVHLRGAIKSGTLAAAAFTLPVGFRPVGVEIFYVVAGPGGARLDVGADGHVTVRDYRSSGTNAMVTLSGVSFATV